MLIAAFALVAIALIAVCLQVDSINAMQRLDHQDYEACHVSYRRDAYGTRHEYRRVLGGWVWVAAHPIVLR